MSVSEEPRKDEMAATAVVDVAYLIYRQLGSGLFESAYERVMIYELESRGFHVARQVPIPLVWKNMQWGNRTVPISPAHGRQILTYLRLAEKRLGFLINFGAKSFTECIHRQINAPRE